MLKSKSLLDYANLFSPSDYEKNHKMIQKLFQQLKSCKKAIVLFVVSVENLKTIKYHIFLTSYEFKSMSYEFKFTSYEFNFTSYEFKSTS